MLLMSKVASHHMTSTERTVQLMTVAENFQLEEGGVVLAPDFPLPTGNGWREYTFFVEVVSQSGGRSKFRAVASPVHHLVRDPAILGGGWRLTIILPGAKKKDIPIGCKVLCSVPTHQRLFGASTKTV